MAVKKTAASTGAEATEEVTENLRVWNALCKTDPVHTKSFSRAGGFKGTATKPIWTALRMTERFGPCGIGWGMEKPEFSVIPADKELAVYCTIGLWYIEGDQRGQVYGVGGDKVVKMQSSGAFVSDEAHKMAYTDAMGNAMKQIGMAADIHMGLFDDSKYRDEVGQEFAAAKNDNQPQAVPAQSPSPAPPPAPEVNDDLKIAIVQAIEAATTVDTEGDINSIAAIMARNKQVINTMKTALPAGYTEVTGAATKRKEQLLRKAAA